MVLKPGSQGKTTYLAQTACWRHLAFTLSPMRTYLLSSLPFVLSPRPTGLNLGPLSAGAQGVSLSLSLSLSLSPLSLFLSLCLNYNPQHALHPSGASSSASRATCQESELSASRSPQQIEPCYAPHFISQGRKITSPDPHCLPLSLSQSKRARSTLHPAGARNALPFISCNFLTYSTQEARFLFHLSLMSPSILP